MRAHSRSRPFDRARLALARLRSERLYAGCSGNPGVSVVLEAGAAAGPLLERTLRSVLEQSHTNLELLLAGDPERALALARALGDPRTRCVPTASPAAGRPGTPVSLPGLARGLWIAPVEVGDVFTTDHLERLLVFAHRGGCEFVSARHAADGQAVASGARVGARGTWLYRSYLRVLERGVVSRRAEAAQLAVRAHAAGARMGFLPELVTLSSPRAVAAPGASLRALRPPRPAPPLRIVR
jgi:hypothetical protein